MSASNRARAWAAREAMWARAPKVPPKKGLVARAAKLLGKK